MKKHRKKKRAGRGAVESGRRSWRGDGGPTVERVLRGPENAQELADEPSAKETEAGTSAGRIVEVRGAELVIEAEGGEFVLARLRKSTRTPHARASAVVVGDDVRFLREGGSAMLTEILPRRTHLTRIRRGHEEHVICANVDLGVVVASAAQPPFKPGLVDRVLVSFVQGGLDPLLALNKADLLAADEIDRMLVPYRNVGVAALALSAVTGAGVDALAERLAGRTAVFSGQSGVGKSSLLNRLAGLDIKIADVYGRLGKGRHTTSSSALYRLPNGGAVIDTPGVRSFALLPPSDESMHAFFPEIFEAAAECRFADCRHRGDDGCAMPAAIAERRVSAGRLESFLALREGSIED
jgi:ribosome biogenesis GTPase